MNNCESLLFIIEDDESMEEFRKHQLMKVLQHLIRIQKEISLQNLTFGTLWSDYKANYTASLGLFFDNCKYFNKTNRFSDFQKECVGYVNELKLLEEKCIKAKSVTDPIIKQYLMNLKDNEVSLTFKNILLFLKKDYYQLLKTKNEMPSSIKVFNNFS